METELIKTIAIAVMYLSGVGMMYGVLTDSSSTTIGEWLLVPVWFLAIPAFVMVKFYLQIYRSVKRLHKNKLKNKTK